MQRGLELHPTVVGEPEGVQGHTVLAVVERRCITIMDAARPQLCLAVCPRRDIAGRVPHARG